MTSAFNRDTWRWHHFSATTLENFEQCERYVFYDKPLGLPKPAFKFQVLGTKLHSQVEHLVDTGQDLFADRLKGIRKFLPSVLPSPTVFAELGLDGKKKGRAFDYSKAPTLLGLPLEGYLDFLELLPDLISIKDLKTTKSIQDWAKTEEQLRRNLQLGLYAWWATLDGWVPVKASHIYAQTEGSVAVKEVPVLFTQQEVQKIVARAEKLAEGLLRLEKVAPDGEYEVEATGKRTGRCEAYGGCPFRDRCFRTPQEVLRARIGLRNLSGGNESNLQKENTLSLQDRLAAAKQKADGANGQTAAPAALQGPPAQAVSPAPPPAPVPAPVEPLSQQELAAVQAALPGGGSWNRDPQGNVLCYGPKTEDGAPLVARIPKGAPPRISEMAVVGGVLVGPPVQAAPTPSGAPRKMEIVDEPAEPAPELRPSLPVGIVPPDAPPNDANAKPEEKRRGRGRPPKTQTVTPPPEQPRAPDPTPVAAQPAPPKEEGQKAVGSTLSQPLGAGGLQLFINCMHLTRPARNLAAYAEEKAKAVADAAQVPDYRLYPEGAVKGKGMLAALVRAEPPEPGAWFASGFTFDSPLGIVVETLSAMTEDVTRGI